MRRVNELMANGLASLVFLICFLDIRLTYKSQNRQLNLSIVFAKIQWLLLIFSDPFFYNNCEYNKRTNADTLFSAKTNEITGKKKRQQQYNYVENMIS